MLPDASEPSDVDGADAVGESSAIFTTRPVALERLGFANGLQRVAGVAASTGCVLAAFHGGNLVRWYPIEDEVNQIDFGRDRCNDISRVFLDRNGFHALITSNSGDSWYLNYMSNQARSLPKLKTHVIEVVSWDAESTTTSTKDLILGTMEGQLLHVVIEGKDTAQKERTVRPLFVFELAGGTGTQPVSGVHRERTVRTVDGSERIVIFVAAGCGVYAFIGPSIETTFQKYQGERAAQRALVFEVPRDSPHGDLQVDSACIGPRSTKVLFWLTGVGVLVSTIKCPLESDQAVLEAPPDLIPFPPPKSLANTRQTGGSLIASLLPPPPPPAPLSMALTQYHIVFLFEDRWAVVSRISHEVVQQQDWARTTYGPLRCLIRESESDKLWMCSEKNMFELACDREDRNAWSLLLQLEQFEDALKLCKRHQQSRVVAAHADWLYRQGRYLDSARKYAEASSVPFEHVALRFSGADKKAALLEYLRCHLQRVQSRGANDDKVARALLGVWAVEVSLAYLNDLRSHGDSKLEAERGKFRELLKACKDLDVHSTIYHLLQSHGWLQELTFFATERRDYTTVILHHVSRCDYASAIRKLGDFQGNSTGEDLVCRFAPVLFGAEPEAFGSLIRRPELAAMSPLSVLAAVFAPQASTVHRREGIRYLEQAVREHSDLTKPGEAGTDGADVRGGPAIGLDGGDPLPGMGEDASSAARRGWASAGAVLNALVVLHACDAAGPSPPQEEGVPAPATGDGAPGNNEALIEAFLETQEKNPLLDPLFGLRVCGERGLARAAVLLYGVMGLHEEAVDVALKRGDVALAKHNACKPADRRLRQRLWLKIVESQAAGGDVQAITKLIRESRELTVRDVLPHMSEMITIDAFKAEICECLDTYEGQILTLRQEMDDHRRALQAFKEDLKQAEERSVVITANQVCEICSLPAVRERFYVFACKHCFHEACLRALVTASPTLAPGKRDRVFALEELRLEHQAVAAGAAPGSLPPTAALAEIEEELDNLLADDCPLCGHLMIQTIRRPFIDESEAIEVESWAID